VTKKVWLPADGILLKKLREEARVEITTLARKHSLSASHIKQLEDGGDSSFYTPAIKLAIGRRLLMHFGADVEPLVEETDKNSVQEREILKDKIDTSHTPHEESVKKEIHRFPQVLGVFVVLASLVYWGFLPASRQSEIGSVNANNELISTTPAAELAAESKTTMSTAPIPTETPAVSPDKCKWVHEPTQVFGYQPTKPGGYVHVIANTNGEICVRDATNTIQIFQLKNTQTQTVRGRPPFEVFSNHLNEFKIFYQGSLLRLPSPSTKTITLKEQKYE
jgi:hypothetical protein